MNENLSRQFTQVEKNNEPEIDKNPSADNSSKNSTLQKETLAVEGESSDPSGLILGKFKTVDDLSKAYSELEKHQGIQSQELGNLRQNSVLINNIQNAWQRENSIRNSADNLKAVSQKYNQPEYFQDPSFRELYREAYLALGKNLDTDRFINLIEGYVASRIFARESMQAANQETQQTIESLGFEKNNKSSLEAPQKRLDEMNDKELDEFLDRLI